MVSDDSKVSYKNGSKGKITIERNLLNDSFNIYIYNDILNTPRTGEITPYISINNDVIIEGDSAMSRTAKILDGGVMFKAFHGMLDDFKFRNIRELNVGLMQGDRVLQMCMIYMAFGAVSKHMDVNEGEIGEIKAIEKIDFETQNPITTNRGTNDIQYPNVVATKAYTSLYYQPHVRKREDAITDLASIYSLHTRGRDPKKYIPNVMSTVKSTGVPSGLQTYIDETAKKDPIDVPYSPISQRVDYIGEIKIDDSTYYDYEKQETVKGYSSDARTGEIIPYNFKGSYTWVQKMDLFDFLKGFQFRTAKNFNHSLLDSFDGDIILTVDNNSEAPLENLKSLSLDNLEIIKQQGIVSLRGLERMSVEEKD